MEDGAKILPQAVSPAGAKPVTPANQAFLRLHEYLQREQYRGYEFDDLLGSRRLKSLTLENLFLQRIVVQAGELSPLNIRPLVGVKKLESSKARGFFARGYLHYAAATGDPVWMKYAEDHLQWLLQHPSAGYPGISWGNAFDFASRGGFFARDKPTVVWTAHIAEAFDMAYAASGRPEYLDALRGASLFIQTSLERHEDARGVCLAYAPGIPSLIFNSNLLGCAALLRWWRHSTEQSAWDVASRALRWTLSYLHEDGSWDYGAGQKYAWKDNFHTAYIIDSLLTAHQIGGAELVPFSAIERSYQYWIGHFFLSDGTPKYYHDRTYPIDIQCAAQAIETLSRLARTFSGAAALADAVTDWTLRHMQKPNGAFRYQIRWFWNNNLESLHWGQATMLSALGAYLQMTANRGTVA